MAKTQAEQVGVPESTDLKPLVPPPADPEQDRPEWLPDKFKDEQAFAHAYEQAERELSSTKEDLARLREQFEQLAEQQQYAQQQQQPGYQQQQYDPAADPLLNALAAAYENGDMHQVAILNASIASQVAAEAARQQVAQQAPAVQDDTNDRVFALLTEQQLEQRYGPVWDSVKADVAEYVQGHPWLIPDTKDPVVAANAFADVTDLVLARRADTGQPAQQPVDQLSLSRQQKLQAQSLTGGGVRTAGGLSPKDELVAQMRQVRSYGYGGG